MEKEKKPRKKRAKKVDHTAYDEYVANVSNGLNPPSAAKRRRKKKPDTEAYDEFLQTEQPAEEQIPEEQEQPEKPAEDYDAYLPGEEKAEQQPEKPRKKRPSGKKRMSKKKRRAKQRKRAANAAYIAVMLLFIAGFGALTVRQMQINERYEAMRAVVEDQRFYEGTTVDGYDISGMTLEEATVFFENSIEPQFRNRSVSLTTGEMFTAEQLGYSSNYVSVLRSAWSSGRNGTLQERYDAIMNGDHAATAHTVTRTFYTEEAVKDAVSGIAKRIDQEAKEPQIDGFDAQTLEFTLDEGQPGYELNQEKLVSDILYVMANGGGNVEPIINAIPVQVDPETALAGYGRISFISTDASTSTQNRLTNLDLSCKAINGLRLDPGEEFSFNAVVGKRTAEKGYKEAGVYNGGADGMDIGGGICQVGSTLFNAAVMADMDITDRQPHSRPVSYLDRGRDAAINWPNQDLKFVNNTDSPVYIVTRLTADKQVECAVYGKLPEDGHTVIIKSSTYEKLNYDTITEYDPSLPPGTHEVAKKGRMGYKAQAWKITLDKDGNEIAKEHLCYSTYKKQDEIIRYNP